MQVSQSNDDYEIIAFVMYCAFAQNTTPLVPLKLQSDILHIWMFSQMSRHLLGVLIDTLFSTHLFMLVGLP